MIYFQARIPKELLHEIEQYLSCRESWTFFNTSKQLFSAIKSATRKIHFRGDDLKQFFRDEKFRSEIGSKILDRNEQLFFATQKNLFLYCIIERIPENAIADWMMDFAKPGIKGLENFYLDQITETFKNFKRIDIGREDYTIDYLSTCSIQQLSIHDNQQVVNVTSFREIPILSLSKCSNLHDISPLTNHSRLEVYRCDITKLCSSLTVQTLGIDRKSSQLLSIVDKQKLKHLIVNEDNRVDSIEHIKSVLPTLQSLDLKACNGLKSLHGIPCIPNIVLRGCENVSDISVIQSPRCVEIYRCEKITSFASLERIPRVIIRDCPQLTDGHDLVHVQHLTIDCPSFKDASMLGGVYHLDLGNSKVDRFSGLENVVILEMNTFPEDGLSVFSSGGNQKIVFRSNGYSRYYLLCSYCQLYRQDMNSSTNYVEPVSKK
jgi:hypothetical protein